MPATHDQQIITLFDGEPIAPGYRGRRTMHVNNQVSGRIAVVFAAALIGFTTAATAMTVKRQSALVERHIRAGANLMTGIGRSVDLEDALY